MQKNNIVSNWLDQYGDPEIDRQVEKEIDYINKIETLKKINLLKVGDVFNTVRGQEFYGEGYSEPIITDYIYPNGDVFKSGKYLVVKTELTGGGCGHGPGDRYPDGYKVTARPLDNEKGLKISFYLTGSFTVMYKTLKPIRNIFNT